VNSNNIYTEGKMKKVFSVLLFSVISQLAFSDVMRCSSKVVSVGDHKIDLLKKCGQPLSKDVRNKCESHVLKNGAYRSSCQDVEEWSYKFGQGQFLTLVEIRDNRISAISQGDR
jgi:hypothetical protein